MTVFDGRIIVVCFLASWANSTALVSLLVFLTRKRLTKSEQWARRTAAHCAFTSCRLPYKRPRGKIKGRGTGTLACFFSFLSVAPFKDGKGSFKPLKIVLERALYKGTGHIKTLHTVSNGVLNIRLCAFTLMTEEKILVAADYLVTFLEYIIPASLWPHCHQALCSSALFNEKTSQAKINATHYIYRSRNCSQCIIRKQN